MLTLAGHRKAANMAETIERTSFFQAEVLVQWRAACAARRAAEAEGDGLLADLMAGRIEDLRELVRHSGVLNFSPACA
jgi:hypothetical protein